eukprot:m.84206 g.84206  ORF g.84206 m.84206 type:complete len:742 (+) comp8710_c0_seq4:184-2409(+)
MFRKGGKQSGFTSNSKAAPSFGYDQETPLPQSKPSFSPSFAGKKKAFAGKKKTKNANFYDSKQSTEDSFDLFAGKESYPTEFGKSETSKNAFKGKKGASKPVKKEAPRKKKAAARRTGGDDDFSDVASVASVASLASGHDDKDGDDLRALISDAINKGETDYFGRGKLMVVGQGRSGKTTTIDSLMGRPFNAKQQSTVGAATDNLAVTVDTEDVQSWKSVRGERTEASRALNAGARAKNKRRAGDGVHVQHGDVSDIPPDGERESEAKEVDIVSLKHADPHIHDLSSEEDLDYAIKTLRDDAILGAGTNSDDDATAVTFKVFDLGGQSTFYVFHQFFLTKYAVYLVVFSMAEVTSKEEDVHKESWEFLMYWLSTLFLYARGAPVFLVGTYGDVIKSRKQHEDIDRMLFNKLNHHPIFEQVIRNSSSNLWFWPVDNSISIEDAHIQDLQKTITSVASTQSFVNTPVPIKSLAFYDELTKVYKETGRPCFTLEEVGEVAASLRLTSEQAIAYLRFWHRFGMLLYYDTIPGMDELVILDPQWAIDMMSKVIRNFSLHHVLEDKNARKHADLWRDFTTRAVLDHKLLAILWENVDGSIAQSFLELMVRFGLIVELAKKSNFSSAPVQLGDGSNDVNTSRSEANESDVEDANDVANDVTDHDDDNDHDDKRESVVKPVVSSENVTRHVIPPPPPLPSFPMQQHYLQHQSNNNNSSSHKLQRRPTNPLIDRNGISNKKFLTRSGSVD